jgi:hypothetical protein
MCDFETSVYEGQKSTEVWAAAAVELGTEDVKVMHSIDDLFNYFIELKCHIIAYFHNLKFDGSFWLSYLLIDKKFKQAYDQIGDKSYEIEWQQEKYMSNNSFKYSISDRGQFYSIIIKVKNHFIEIRDSLKLLPFSVKRIGESFKTKHKKLEMEYKGFRYAGCEITPKEREYIANDVLVVKEALEIMFSEGHDRLTIGSCCLSEYKRICQSSTKNALSYDEMYPDLTQLQIDDSVFGCANADQYIRRSYRGGWCYLVKGKEEKVLSNGTTADVNSLYPSVMHSESGNRYPVGIPYFWVGNIIPDEALKSNRFYFIRIKTRFYIKPGKLPFVQIKNSYLYKPTEMLETSDAFDPETGKYYPYYKNMKGEITDTRVTLTLTMTDYALLKEHYELVDFEILNGCWFYSEIGIFDEYIDKYKQIKQTSKGALRELAKLFLNNLYGKMSSNTDSSFKLAYVKDDGSIGFDFIPANNKKPGYIAVGSAITSYARNFTIQAAQQNFYGSVKPGFTYADTDSIHCDLPHDKIKGITVHPTNFCCWKLETYWDKAYFTRQKTYIEHVVAEDEEYIDNPYNLIKCAGMPDKCKNLFELSMLGTANYEGYTDKLTGEFKEWTDDEKAFLFNSDHTNIIRTYDDFKPGQVRKRKSGPKRIKGGILLVDTTYEMR